ncbi:MAG: hypothetical protein Q4A37_01905 [Candidatus Saccharibacteria bacterium]|nr:hypothetical protein [Candidatus Saccharibacteria bacterium]
MREIVRQLRPGPSIQDFMERNTEWSNESSRQLGIVAKYITIQALLHLPYYNEEEIIHDDPRVLSGIDRKVLTLGKDYKDTYDRLYESALMGMVSADAKLKGKNVLSIHDEADIIPVRFGSVPIFLAKEINDHLHYIRSARDDSIANYGLFIDGAETPYASVSFSRCSRDYQLRSLNEVAGTDLQPDQILSMTRAFTFNNAPRNSMSKLFHQSHKQISRDYPHIKAIITALNPYMGFDGGVFTGASYTPYALSPMEYWYDENQFYAPRSKGIYPQKTETPPILWLAHGLDRDTAVLIESIPIDKLKHITRDEYREK